MKKKTPAQLQAEYESDLKKFSDKGAALNDEGKYLLCILREGDPGGAMAYFYDRNYNRVRMCASTFYRLLDEDKAIRVDHDDI